MPSDILGTEILEEDHGTGQRHFRFQPGPVFTNLLLADELNRTPPKTQAALLEAMQEHTVSYAGVTHALPRAVLRAGDAEPDRAGRHLSAARSAARPLPAAHPRRLPERGRGARHPRADHRHAARRSVPRGDGRRTTCWRCRRCVREVHLGDDLLAWITRLVRASRPAHERAAEVRAVGAAGARARAPARRWCWRRRRARCCTAAWPRRARTSSRSPRR